MMVQNRSISVKKKSNNAKMTRFKVNMVRLCFNFIPKVADSNSKITGVSAKKFLFTVKNKILPHSQAPSKMAK